MSSRVAIGLPDTVLLAPGSFRDRFGAPEVAAALQRGLAASGQPAEVCPVADGREGTLSVLAPPLGLEHVTVRVSDPLGREVDAAFGLGRRGVAVVEAAAGSYGTGELIAAALAAGAQTVYVAVGGSAATDGGEGAVRAILERGGIGKARLVVLCDALTPGGGSTIGGGGGLAGGGLVGGGEVGGGLAAGLWAHFGAELVAGAPFVLDAVGYDARMRRALAVITGEGSLDRESLVGTLVAEVATRARQAGVPCHAVLGVNGLSRFDLRILDLQMVLEASTLEEIEAAGAAIGAETAAQRARGR